VSTYTYGQTPDIEIIARLPHKYKMELNKSNMMHLLKQLCLEIQCAEQLPPDATVEQEDELLAEDAKQNEWASNFRTSILTTIGIEEV